MKHRVFFLCPNNKFISGGVRQIFHQAEILNKKGIEAYVLLNKRKRQGWFQSQAHIAYSPYLFKQLHYAIRKKKLKLIYKLKLNYLKQKGIHIKQSDVLVTPEIYGGHINKLFPNNPVVIFNQNCYYTLNTYDETKSDTPLPYQQSNTLGTIVVSDDSLAYLNYVFPMARVYRIHIGIQATFFHDYPNKKKQICYMPRKLNEDIAQIIYILKQHDVLHDWQLIPIENKTEEEVAQIMKESIFFLSFNYREGFGLPPAEAMACGCYVIGYHGEAGREYFKPEFSTVVENRDIITYTKKVEELIAIYNQTPKLIIEKGRKAAAFIAANYSMEQQEAETIRIWEQLLKIAKE